MPKTKPKTTAQARVPQTKLELLKIVDACIDEDVSFTLSRQRHSFTVHFDPDTLPKAIELFPSLFPTGKAPKYGQSFSLALSGAPDSNGE